MSDLIERAKAALDGYTGQEIAESERLSFASSVLADAEALKAADLLAGEIQTAISCAGPSDFWVSAARQALFNYRKARGGE